MTTPEIPETPASPEWDEFLADRLSNYGQALRSGILSAAEVDIPEDCPAEVLEELKELENCLSKLKQACGLNRETVESPLHDDIRSSPPQSDSEIVLTGGATAQIGVESPSENTFVPFSDLRLGRFEIGQKLGEGTYGIVYLAFDPGLKRNVAVKIPRLEAALRGDLHQRFLLEAESSARLSHPNIVRVFEGMSDGAVSLIVSEYIQGPSLAKWLAKRNDKRIPPRQAAELIAALAGATSHAHTMGVLHRDIKPSNILLAPKGFLSKRHGPFRVDELDEYDPKLTDFGLAKLLETQDISVSGAIIGTPAYMPPEQIAGRTGEVGVAADVYSLGMVLYELLTGKNPFIAQSITETIHNVTRGDLPQLTAQADRTIPADLATICFKCLRQDKSERYSHAADLEEDLRRFLDGRAIHARDVPPLERAVKWCRRHPALTASSFITLISLLSLLVVSLRNWQVVTRANLKQAEIIEELEKRDYVADLKAASEYRVNGNVELMESRLLRHLPQAGRPDRRTFPWWYLWREINETSQVVIDYPEGEAEAALSQDESMLATGGEDLAIHLWSLPERKRIGELKGHTEGTIECLRFFNGTDPAGKPRNWLLSAAGDGDARLWDVDSRKELLRLKHQDWLPVAIFLGEHAEYIATGDDFGTIRIWSSADGSLVREIPDPETRIRALCEVPQENLILSSSGDPVHSLKFWNWKTGIRDARVPDGTIALEPQQWSGALHLSPDRKKLAVGCSGGNLIIFGLGPENFGNVIAFHKFEMEVRSLDWRDDGSLVIAHGRQVLIARDPQNQDCQWERFLGHRHSIWSLTASSRRPEVYSCDRFGEIRVIPTHVLIGNVDVPGSQLSTAPPFWNGEYFSLRLNDGFYLVKEGSSTATFCAPIEDASKEGWHTPLGDGRGIAVLQTKGGNEFLTCYRIPENAAGRIAVEPAWKIDLGRPYEYRRGGCLDNRLLGIGVEGACWIIDLQTGEKIATLPHASIARGIAFSPLADRLYTTGGDGEVRVWNISDWSLIRSFRGHDQSSICVAVSDDGKLLATSGQDAKAQIYRTDDFSVIASFNVSAHNYEIDLLDHGKTLVVMSTDRNTEFFSIDGDSPVLIFQNPGAESLTRTSSNGKTVVTHDAWGHVHLYRNPR